MKKRMLFAALLLGLFFCNGSYAQSTEGGIPWSMTNRISGLDLQNIPVTTLAKPDYAKARKEDAGAGASGAYRFGLPVSADVSLKNAGKVIYLDNGNKIWIAKVKVDGALATYFDYDRFHLPKGVSLFLKNESGKQVIGAINYKYNPRNGIYSTVMVQGNTATIELDIQAGVALSGIQLHINKVIAAYRGGVAETLNYVYGIHNGADVDAQEQPLDYSNPCEVNAVCEPEGTQFIKIRKTAAQVTMGGYLCSGNLLNNTSEDCEPLFLLASHCNEANATDDSAFSTWHFFFNYEYPLCENNTVSMNSLMDDYLIGAQFRARSYYASTPQIVGDFILLKLNDPENKLGNDFDAYLAGWDLSQIPPNSKYIDFHFPAGDPKKVTVFDHIQGNGNFNGGQPGSHWKLSYLELGGIEGGSSGSGIFSEANSRLYGDLSGGPTFTTPCDDTSLHMEQNYSEYSKLYLNWDYAGGDHTAATRLKDWLDPNNTGQTYTNTIKVASDSEVCGADDTTGIDVVSGADLTNAITIYPNPTSGIVTAQLNLAKVSNLEIEVINILGKKVGVFSANGVTTGNVKINLEKYPSGIYFLRFHSGNSIVTKKIVLRK